MKNTALLLMVILSSCSNDIAGVSRSDRLRLYGAAAGAAGHPEVAVPLMVLSKRLDAKQPSRTILDKTD